MVMRGACSYLADQSISVVKQHFPRLVLDRVNVFSNIETLPYLGKHVKQLFPVVIPTFVIMRVSSPKSL